MTNSPSILGTGMYTPTNNFQINQSGFNNPNYNPNQYGQAYNQLGSTTGTAPVATATPSASPYTQLGLQGQTNLAGQYGAMAAGQGPSLATVQAQQQGAANIQAANSVLGSARGAGNPAAAQLASQQQLGQQNQQTAENAVAGRTQEELGALGAEGSLYGSIGAQGLQSQQIGNQANQFNASAQNQAALQAQQLQLQAQTSQAQLASTQGLAQQQGGQAYNQLGVTQQTAENNNALTAFNDSATNNQAALKLGMQGAGAALGGLSGLGIL